MFGIGSKTHGQITTALAGLLAVQNIVLFGGEKNMIELVVNEEREKEICEFETKMFAKYKLLSYRNGVGDIIREQEIS